MTLGSEPTADDWKRLGKAIEDRRFHRGYSQEELVKRGGPSHQTVRNIERGLPADYRPTTFRKLDRALDWRDGTSEKILNGTATEAELAEVVARPGTATGGGFVIPRTGPSTAELIERAEQGDPEAQQAVQDALRDLAAVFRDAYPLHLARELLTRLVPLDDLDPAEEELVAALGQALPALRRRLT